MNTNIFKVAAVKDIDAALKHIPIIDCGETFRGSAEALESIAVQVRRACETVGFFYLRNHGVDSGVIRDGFDASREFHRIPLEEKLKLTIDENNVGYMGLDRSQQNTSTVHKATRPNYSESFYVSHDRPDHHPDVLAGKWLRGQNHWPRGHETMRAHLVRYFKELEALAERMLPVFARALEMPADFFGPFFANEAHIKLRCLYYPSQHGDTDSERFGLGPHIDNSFCTLLAREDVPGLAIRLPSGEWMPAPIVDGTFLVNLGRTMLRWTNERFLATQHGVLNDSGRDRYALSYFYCPNPDVTIECLPTCTRPDNPPKYPPIVYREMVRSHYDANYFHHQENDYHAKRAGAQPS